MSTCTNWVTRVVIECKNWSERLDYECTTWADEGSNECSEWADEGSSRCTSWEECHWYTPWNCIAGFFCRAWYWVAKWVCKGWYWVAKWVCKAFAWVVKAVCVVWSWGATLVCVAWDTLRCALLSLLRALSRLFGKGRRAGPQVEHVFVLMLENRSFDHMLGFSDITGVGIDGNPTSVDGADPSRDRNTANGVDFPVATPADLSLKDVDEDPGHEFDDTVVQLCGPDVEYQGGAYPQPITNAGFAENYLDRGSPAPGRIMRCYTREQLPVMNALAREFAVCDRWFSSLPGPTFPNRFFAVAASSGGLDDSPSKLDIVTAMTVEGYRFENGNIFDLLDQYCIEWEIYEGDEFPVCFALSGMGLNALQGRFEDFDELAPRLSATSFGPKFVFIEPKYGRHEFAVTGPGDFTCGNSMHPLDDVTRGEKLIKDVYEAIRNSPHWEKSLLIVTFDEHGGFYDHVPPGAAVPPGDTVTQSYVHHNFEFDQLGVRVPALVISPFTRRGVVDHTDYDHTSILATVQRLFGMKSLTNRDAAANDLLHLLSLGSPRGDAPTSLPDPAANPNPLDCDDDEDEDVLLAKRSELRIAQKTGRYGDRRTEEFPPTSTQIGFAQVALLRVLQTAAYPEREQWLEQYLAIDTGVDAALFMTESKLKVVHGIDLKRFDRADNPDKNRRPRRRRRRERSG
jgi:phospholipase C